jgi:hypothetical protein
MLRNVAHFHNKLGICDIALNVIKISYIVISWSVKINYYD